MRIVVIGGGGLIGSKLVHSLRANHRLRENGSDLADSRTTSVDSVAPARLTEVLEGTHVVVDVANFPTFEDNRVFEFSQTAWLNLMTAEAAAGVQHHITLSMVGIDRYHENEYFRAQSAQEEVVKSSGIPYTIVRSTQIFDFMASVTTSGIAEEAVRVSPALLQPIASDDVVAVLAEVALGTPVNGTMEIAGPEQLPLDDIIRRYLFSLGDPRPVISDVHARFLGLELYDTSLTADGGAHIGLTRFDDWLRKVKR